MKTETTTSLQEAIAVCRYYCGLKPTEYEQYFYESAFAYAKDFGSDELTLSDTFWKWYSNQYSICTRQLAFVLKNESTIPSEDVMREVFERAHTIGASDLYPHSIIHNKIMNEIFQSI